jgi:hypothetical protein
VFDNPDTMSRECWQDGKLLCSYSANLLLRRLSKWETQPVPGEKLFFGANIGDWITGQLVGDPCAMLELQMVAAQQEVGE